MLLVNILQHVPCKQRLTSAGLVSRGWASAALLATTVLDHAQHPSTTDALEEWLEQHAAQLQGLKLSSSTLDKLTLNKLPWAKLTSLRTLVLADFDYLPIPLNNSSSSTESAASELLLPALKHLELHDCTFKNKDGLLQLVGSSPAGLTCLRLSGNPAYKIHEPQDVADGVMQVLQRLPELKVLQLCGPQLSPELTRAVEGMALTSLHMSVDAGRSVDAAAPDTPSWFVTMPTSLTRLELADHRNRNSSHGLSYYKSPTLPRELPHLSNLLELHLEWCSFYPAILQEMPNLRLLNIKSVDPRREPQTPTHSGVSGLLSAVAHLTQLQHLSIEGMALGVQGAGMPLTQFSALTASTQLTRLELMPLCIHDWFRDDPFCTPAVPHGALTAAFPAGRQLPHLQELCVRGGTRPEGEIARCMSVQDVASIISACPALKLLDITHAVAPEPGLSAALDELPESCKVVG